MLVTQTPPLPGSSEAAKSPSLTDLSETVSPSKKEPHAIPPSRQQSAMVASPIDFSPPSSPVPSFAVKAPSVISTSASASGANPFEQSGDGGLRVSIVETLSVLAKQGQAPRAQVTGELYLQLGQLQDGVEQFTLRLPEAGSLQRLAPNTQIISSADGGALTVQAKALQEATTSAPVVALRYHVPLPQEQVESLLPLQLSSQWKCEPDLTSLIIQYNSNPSSSFASADSILKDISFAVPVTSPGVAHVKSRPPGMYNADRKRITWRLDDLPLRGDAASQKVLARFQVAEQSSPQPVAVRWSLPGRLISSLSPILDDGPLGQIEEISRRTVSGKYLIQ